MRAYFSTAQVMLQGPDIHSEIPGEKVTPDSEEVVPIPEWDDYQVDLTHWQPTKQIVKNLQLTGGTSDPHSWSYDFKDGKDTGMDVPVDRYKGLDPTEVQALKESYETDVKEDVEKAISEKQAELQQQQLAQEGAGGNSASSGAPAQ